VIEVAFSLVDHEGRAVTPATYRGRWLLVFFGFTHCKVVCPRNLGKLSAVLEALGPDARSVLPLYVSVDPERDTPARMKGWLGENFPRFTGLTGSREAAEAARKAFRVFAARRPGADGSVDYDVPHSAITYLVDPLGHFRDHFPETLDQAMIAERIAGHLSSEAAS